MTEQPLAAGNTHPVSSRRSSSVFSKVQPWTERRGGPGLSQRKITSPSSTTRNRSTASFKPFNDFLGQIGQLMKLQADPREKEQASDGSIDALSTICLWNLMVSTKLASLQQYRGEMESLIYILPPSRHSLSLN